MSPADAETRMQFVFALRACLNPIQPVGNGKINRPIVAQLEMQVLNRFAAAPVAAEQCLALAKGNGAGDPPAIAPLYLAAGPRIEHYYFQKA